MTAKERLLKCAPDWTEEQAFRALRAAEADDGVDQWGDAASVHDTNTAETMRRLAAEEHIAGHHPG